MTDERRTVRLEGARSGAPRRAADAARRRSPGGIDDVEISPSPWPAGINDLLAVGRPRGVFVVVFRDVSTAGFAAFDVDHPDVLLSRAGRAKDELRAVGRPFALKVVSGMIG